MRQHPKEARSAGTDLMQLAGQPFGALARSNMANNPYENGTTRSPEFALTKTPRSTTQFQLSVDRDERALRQPPKPKAFMGKLPFQRGSSASPNGPQSPQIGCKRHTFQFVHYGILGKGR